MVDPFDWAELQRLAQNVAAAHISMVAFLEEACVPWSDDQTLEFERIAAAQLTALNDYAAFTNQDEPAMPRLGYEILSLPKTGVLARADFVLKALNGK